MITMERMPLSCQTHFSGLAKHRVMVQLGAGGRENPEASLGGGVVVGGAMSNEGMLGMGTRRVS